MLLSVHPDAYDIHQARRDKAYGRHFTWHWKTVDTRSSAEFSRIITSRVWSPCIFSDGHRCIDSFVEARLLVLDFDHPGYSLAQAINEWCDTIHWIGITKSHQREKNGITCDRFRVVVPFETPITSEAAYKYNYRRIAEHYDTADPCTKDGGRLFFPCQEVVSVCLDGEPQPVVPIPAEDFKRAADKADLIKQQRKCHVVPSWLWASFERIIPHGKRADTIWRVSKDLTRYGYEEDEIVGMFLASPTFKDPLPSASSIKVIREQVKSGVKASRRESCNLGAAKIGKPMSFEEGPLNNG